jgi:hypothetical protein
MPWKIEASSSASVLRRPLQSGEPVPPLLLGEGALGAPVELKRADQGVIILRHQATGRPLQRAGQAPVAMVHARRGVAHILHVDLVAQAIDRLAVRVGLGETQGDGHVRIPQSCEGGLVLHGDVCSKRKRCASQKDNYSPLPDRFFALSY